MFEPGRLRELITNRPGPCASGICDEQRRPHILALFLGTFSAVLTASAQTAQINPTEAQIALPEAIQWSSWPQGFSPDSSQTATLYGGLGRAVPVSGLDERVWSAPHTCVTYCEFAAISGICSVNLGVDFDPANSPPVPAGSLVKPVSRARSTDGVVAAVKAPAVIAFFGIDPVDFHLVSANNPARPRVFLKDERVRADRNASRNRGLA